jgi:hypothetical protein
MDVASAAAAEHCSKLIEADLNNSGGGIISISTSRRIYQQPENAAKQEKEDWLVKRSGTNCAPRLVSPKQCQTNNNRESWICINFK